MTLRPDRKTDTGAVRRAAVAGQFYSADPVTLERDVNEMLGRCYGHIPAGVPVALVSPHAGYRYSGPTAAEGYSAVRSGKFDVVVIVAPSHREYFDGISIFPGKSYATPMGELSVDDDLRRALTVDDRFIRVSEEGHRDEHAVEVQLPFIIALFGALPFLPVVMGDQRGGLCLHLGTRLAAALAGRRALIVASTDLSHYHPSDVARRIDARFVALLEQFDVQGIIQGLDDGSLEACGGGPVVAALSAASAAGADRVVVRRACNSGDTGGDTSSVVGYVSAVAMAS